MEKPIIQAYVMRGTTPEELHDRLDTLIKNLRVFKAEYKYLNSHSYFDGTDYIYILTVETDIKLNNEASKTAW